MSITQERVEKIRAFDERGRRIEKQYEEVPLSSDAVQSYNRKLDETIKGLQGHVRRQEDILRKVCGKACRCTVLYICKLLLILMLTEDLASGFQARSRDP